MDASEQRRDVKRSEFEEREHRKERLEGNRTRVSGQRGDMNRVSQGTRPPKLTKVTQGVNLQEEENTELPRRPSGCPPGRCPCWNMSIHKAALGTNPKGAWTGVDGLTLWSRRKQTPGPQARPEGTILLGSPRLSPALTPTHCDAGLPMTWWPERHMPLLGS